MNKQKNNFFLESRATDVEDIIIEELALSDPENPPLTDEEWEKMLPKVRNGDNKIKVVTKEIKSIKENKVIVEIGAFDSDTLKVAKVFDPEANTGWIHVLRFSSLNELYKKLSFRRAEILTTLNNIGACSVYALAKNLNRSYANVHGDVKILEQLGLIIRNSNNLICSAFDKLEIKLDFTVQNSANNDSFRQVANI